MKLMLLAFALVLLVVGGAASSSLGVHNRRLLDGRGLGPNSFLVQQKDANLATLKELEKATEQAESFQLPRRASDSGRHLLQGVYGMGPNSYLKQQKDANLVSLNELQKAEEQADSFQRRSSERDRRILAAPA